MVEIVKAYLIATVKRGTEHTAAQKIRKMNEIIEVLVTYGFYDIIVRIEAKSLGQLDKIARTYGKLQKSNRQASLLVPSEITANPACEKLLSKRRLKSKTKKA